MGNSSSLLGALADIPDKSFDDDVEADKGASDFKDKGAIDGIEESKEPAASRSNNSPFASSVGSRLRSRSNFESTFKQRLQEEHRQKKEIVLMSQLREPFNLSRSGGVPSEQFEGLDD